MGARFVLSVGGVGLPGINALEAAGAGGVGESFCVTLTLPPCAQGFGRRALSRQHEPACAGPVAPPRGAGSKIRHPLPGPSRRSRRALARMPSGAGRGPPPAWLLALARARGRACRPFGAVRYAQVTGRCRSAGKFWPFPTGRLPLNGIRALCRVMCTRL